MSLSRLDILQLTALLDALQENALSEADGEQLARWLMQSDAAQRFYIEYQAMSVSLSEYAREKWATTELADALTSTPGPHLLDAIETLADSAASQVTVTDITEQLHRRELEQQAKQSAQQRRLAHWLNASDPIQPVKHYVIPKIVFYGAIAAVIAVTALLFWPNQTTPISSVAVKDQPVAPPVIAAVMTRMSDAKWADSSSSPQVGAALTVNQSLNLHEGAVAMTFHDGTQVIIEGPARFTPINHQQIAVHQGKIVAQSPAGVKHFSVSTPSAMVVDLGTHFGVNVQADQSTETRVFQGRVRFEGVKSQLQSVGRVLDRNMGARIERDGQTYTSLAPTAASEYLRNWNEVEDRVAAFGDIRLLRNPPTSVVLRELAQDQTIHVFRESQGVTLPQAVRVNFTLPGAYQKFDSPQYLIPAQTRVDSYLVHYDTKTNSKLTFAQGKLIFPRRIVGVMINDQWLSATDRTLGHGGTQYDPNQPGRALEGHETENAQDQQPDGIEIGADGRTLRVRFGVKEAIDQIRVLIEAKE